MAVCDGAGAQGPRTSLQHGAASLLTGRASGGASSLQQIMAAALLPPPPIANAGAAAYRAATPFAVPSHLAPLLPQMTVRPPPLSIAAGTPWSQQQPGPRTGAFVGGNAGQLLPPTFAGIDAVYGCNWLVDSTLGGGRGSSGRDGGGVFGGCSLSNRSQHQQQPTFQQQALAALANTQSDTRGAPGWGSGSSNPPAGGGAALSALAAGDLSTSGDQGSAAALDPTRREWLLAITTTTGFFSPCQRCEAARRGEGGRPMLKGPQVA
jgi:hypothetical protein